MTNATASSFSNRWIGIPRLNRRVGRLALFEKPADYLAFENILKEAHDPQMCAELGMALLQTITGVAPVSRTVWRLVSSDFRGCGRLLAGACRRT